MKNNIEHIEELVNDAIEHGINPKEASKLSMELKQADEQIKEAFHHALNAKFEQISAEVSELVAPVNM
ncbi:MAG: hypothetical protein MUE81_07155 [Thermoflexibacter sp.]|jgi:hypothetical protein|nr:hypothetical protein [Thermoflexibacter sp.]